MRVRGRVCVFFINLMRFERKRESARGKKKKKKKKKKKTTPPPFSLLPPLSSSYRHVDVVQQLRVVLDGRARREENDDLLLGVAAQEGEEQQEAGGRWDDAVALLQPLPRRGRLAVVHAHVQGRPLEGQAGQVLHFRGLRRRKQGGLAVAGQELDNLAHLLLKTRLQDAVGLVGHEKGEVARHERPRVLEVVQEAAGRGDEEVDALGQALRLRPPVGAAHDQAVRLGGGAGGRGGRRGAAAPVLLPCTAAAAATAAEQVPGDRVDLHGQFPGGGDHQGARPVARGEAGPRQELGGRDQKRQRFARPRLGGPQHVPPGQQGRDGAGLHLRHGGKAHGRNGGGGAGGQVQGGEGVRGHDAGDGGGPALDGGGGGGGVVGGGGSAVAVGRMRPVFGGRHAVQRPVTPTRGGGDSSSLVGGS